MPTYQYACTECGAQMEVVQSFSDDALTVCPECEGRLRKVYSAVGIVFKGSGFYRTDSGKSSNSSVLTGSGSGESKDGGNSGSGDSGSTDSSSTSSDSKSSSSDTSSTSASAASKAGSASATAATG
ncbi:FmdB family zinc ribbon protein [Nocardiopsis alborubida]|uniref:FmdB family transcriptional regulator n=1 Tax=Nocardiopsis alborubida TaxID=146802 RepID=A0A7X6MLJ5_9ACTN|nr:FmdB family zinc ribbon protein [Nocardiopsis alborubida]NKZ01716.1 FmdB family transcriptional regulator [Nocardiopsis alborubida]